MPAICQATARAVRALAAVAVLVGLLAGSASAATGLLPPTNSVAPAISGSARDEQTLTSTTGTWSGVGNSYSRQWLRCDAAGNGCASIPAATQSGYVLTPADIGKTIRVRVLASYALGSNDATSVQTAVVTPAPPTSSSVPVLSGTARDTQTLTASTGAWRGTPPLSFTWQWRRCDSAGANCADIPGQATASYSLTPADVGKTMRANVTASNVAGSAPATTAASAVIVADPPANTGAPTISGVFQEGRDLTLERGAWTGTPTIGYAYKWQRCAPVGGCAPIGGATNATYTLVAADLGQRVLAAVTATNAAASRSASSIASDVVSAGRPLLRSAPSASGTERDGHQMTVAPGTWTGTSPIAYAYQWLRCSTVGSSCTPIGGAEQRTYTLQSADVGKTVRPRVTASNTAGASETDGTASGVIAGTAPQNTVAPSIGGAAEVGKQLTAQPGTWSGTTPIAYAYQWRRCDAAGNACQDIPGATGASHALTAQEADLTVLVRVRATNVSGSTDAGSAARTVQAQGCTTTFLPATGSWATATNWSSGSVPGAADNACVPAGRSVQLSGGSTIASLAGDGEVKLYSDLALTSTEHASRIGRLLLNGGTLTGAGDLTIGAALTWTSGTMAGTGSTIVASEATGSVEAGMLSRTLVNRGSLTGTGTSFFRGDSAALLDNRGTFTSDNQYGLRLSVADATPTVRNTGLFRKTWTGNSSIEWRFDNDGTVLPGGTATSGRMHFSGGGVPGDESTGTWGPGTYWSTGTFKLGPSTQISGSVVSSSTLEARSLDLTADSDLNLWGGTLAITDTSTTSDLGKVTLTNVGNLSGAGDVRIKALTWTNGSMTGAGRTIIPQGATGYIERGDLSRTLVNDGTVTATSTGDTNFVRGTSAAVLDNRGTFTLDIVDTPTGNARGLLKSDPSATPTVRNTGLFRKTSSGRNHIDWRFDNDGVVQPNGTGTDGWMFFTGGDVPGDEATGSWGQGSQWFSSYKLGPETRITGKVLVSGTLRARSIDIGDDAEIRVSQGTLESTDTASASRVANLRLENGNVRGAGDLVITKSLYWEAGAMTEAGRTILAPGATGVIMRGELGRTLVNRGQLTHAQASYSAAWLMGAAGAVLDNEGVLNLDSQSPNPPQVRTLPGSPVPMLRNRGVVRKSAGTGDTMVDWAYADQGITQELTTGKLRFIGPIIGSGVGSADAAGPSPGELQGGFNAAIPGLSTCAQADPVSCLTGDFYENLSDIQIAGRGRSLAAARSYSAQAAQREAGTAESGGPARLGPGWTHPYATRLELPAGYVRLVGANGATALWKANADGTFGAAERVKARLTRGDASGYVVTYKDQTRDVFDSSGRLQRQVDRNGYATTLAYDGNGRIDYVADEAGRRLTYAHDAAGRISAINDPAGRLVHYDYDANGDLTTVVDVAGKAWSYGYDGQHRIVSMRDPLGHETTNVYDAESRVARQTDAAGGVTRFAYTPSSTTVTNPRGFQSRYELTGGLVSRVVRGVGTAVESTVTMVRNASGNVTRRTDPDGQVTQVEYDGPGNATKLTDPLDRVTTMTYSPANDVLTVTEPDSATTTMTYDSGGNIKTMSRPLTGTGSTQTTAYAYDPAKPGDLVSLTDPNGKVWSFGYDGYGNRTSTTDPVGDKSTIAYNPLGWPTSGVSARGNATGADPDAHRSTTAYDDRGQPLLQTDPLGATVRTAYDAVGNPISVTEPGEKTTGTAYDELDRPTTVTRADGSFLRFAYDANGNRTSVKDGAGRETTFTYDALDRKATESDPAGRTTTYGYDRSDRQTTLVDAAGRSTSLGYDAGSQLQQIDYADSATADVDYDYDAAGRRVRMVDGTGTNSYAYDAFDRLTSATDAAGRQLRYAYDLADRLTRITYPDDLVEDTAPAGRTIADPSVTRSYDDAGRITAITDWLGGRTEYDHDRNGNVTEQRYPNQTKAVMSYDRADRLARRTDTGPGSTTVLDLPYTRRLNGQLQTLNRSGDQPGQTQTLTYDGLDQLTEATVGSGAEAQTYGYVHDIADRLTRIVSPDATTTLEYDAANQLLRTRDTGSGQVRSTFSFDAVGSRTAQDPAGPVAATTYAHDQASRLTHYEAPAAVAGDPAVARDYAYDGDGLRADLLWDSTGDLPLVLGDSAGLYVTGPEGLPLTQLRFDGEQRYYHHDQLGSTRAITNAAGAVTARYTFDPYGNPAAGSSAVDSRFGYAGQYTDRATGLIYMRARWYDPATGQFITADPVGLASGETNLFRYAGGDPANLVDPSGLLSIADVSNFASGVYDELTFGATRKIRELIGSDGVDYCSGAYNAGGHGGMAAGMIGPGGIGRGAGKAVAYAEEGVRWLWKTRTRPGRDGGISRIGIERSGDDAISQVHTVSVDGKIVHQHQTHIGKYGGERQFPDDWVQFPSVGLP